MMGMRNAKCIRKCNICDVTVHGIPVSAMRAGKLRPLLKKLKILHLERPSDTAFPIRILNDKNGICLALNKRTGKCSIYKLRPDVCREYPVSVLKGEILISPKCIAVRAIVEKGINKISHSELLSHPLLKNSLYALLRNNSYLKPQKAYRITDVV